MTTRSDILPDQDGWRKLSYTRRCGWIDWGHAVPRGPRELLRQVMSESGSDRVARNVPITLAGSPAFVVHYGQKMGKLGLMKSREYHWVVHRGLSRPAREGAALAIFMEASLEFERMQGSFPFGLVSSSGFSGEDLVSNLVGFYSALRGWPSARARAVCGGVGVEESLRI